MSVVQGAWSSLQYLIPWSSYRCKYYLLSWREELSGGPHPSDKCSDPRETHFTCSRSSLTDPVTWPKLTSEGTKKDSPWSPDGVDPDMPGQHWWLSYSQIIYCISVLLINWDFLLASSLPFVHRHIINRSWLSASHCTGHCGWKSWRHLWHRRIHS